MKKFFAVMAAVLAFTTVAHAEWDVTSAANKVKETADAATAKIEAQKSEAAAKKAQAEADKAAKKAEQEKAINDAKESLENLKDVVLSK